MADIIVVKGVQLEPQNAPTPSRPGGIELQNILGVVKLVDDQGVATSIGGGGGTVSANSLLGNNTGSPAAAASLSVAQVQAMGIGFGADTIVQINNGSGSPVSALEVVAALTTATAGSEASSWTVKLLSAGAQVTALTVTPDAALFRDGSSLTAPGIAFAGSTGTGFARYAAGTGIAWSYGGVLGGYLSPGGINFNSNVAQIAMGSAVDTIIKRSANGLELTTFGTGDILMAVNPTVAGTAGFLKVPAVGGVAGTPAHAAQGCMMYVDTTNNLVKFYYGGAWKSAALT